MRRFFRENQLSIALTIIFAAMLVLHSAAGFYEFNNEQREHHQPKTSYSAYLFTSHFAESVSENWESEFLQMAAFVFMTRYLRQKGSAESRKLKEEESEEKREQQAAEEKARLAGTTPWPVTKGGVILKLYENSLWIAFALLFLFSFLAHAFSSYKEHLSDHIAHGLPSETFRSYLASSGLWFESFQNWQSEFLAILMMVVLSIFLRDKESPESKPAGASHGHTGK